MQPVGRLPISVFLMVGLGYGVGKEYYRGTCPHHFVSEGTRGPQEGTDHLVNVTSSAFSTLKFLLFSQPVLSFGSCQSILRHEGGVGEQELTSTSCFDSQMRKVFPVQPLIPIIISFIWKLQHLESLAHNRALNHMRFYLFICSRQNSSKPRLGFI